MKVKKYLIIACILGTVFALSGCGESFPEMTEEEYNQTVEFAVGILLKHSNNDQSKLTYVNAKEEKKAREKAARKAAEESGESTAQKPPETTQTAPAISTTPESHTSSQDDNTENYLKNDGTNKVETDESVASEDSTIDIAEGNASDELSNETVTEGDETDTSVQEESSAPSDPNALVMSSDESMEIMDGIHLSYQGYSVSSTYPESSKSYVINADKGKRLLVLRFDLYNGTDSSKKVNLIDKNILIQVILNGKNLGYSAVTFLPNDLTSYVGTIESRAHESLVVLTEIDQSASTSIQTLGMKVSISGIERDVTLR